MSAHLKQINADQLINEQPPVKNGVSQQTVYTATQTSEIAAKTTVPTLVEFQSKTPTLPDWRIKVQNAVQQRRVQPPAVIGYAEPTAPQRMPTNGANALKVEYVEETAPVRKDEMMSRVLERIEKSRAVYLVEESIVESSIGETANAETNAPDKNFPFHIAAKNPEIFIDAPRVKATVNQPIKPKLVSSMRAADVDLDTNKLPPFSAPGKIAVDLETLPKIQPTAEESAPVVKKPKTIHIVANENEIINAANTVALEVGAEEIDDLAPFSLRFNAGLFDLIIGSFASLILISPLMLWGGEWVSFKGFLAFLVVCSIVMFIYLTTTTAFFGRTLGMKIFSLELIDIEENDYPTFHQAAVNSAVYLLSMLFGGIGFLTIPFNEEKRAVHDLVSGTIVVKE